MLSHPIWKCWFKFQPLVFRHLVTFALHSIENLVCHWCRCLTAGRQTDTKLTPSDVDAPVPLMYCWPPACSTRRLWLGLEGTSTSRGLKSTHSAMFLQNRKYKIKKCFAMLDNNAARKPKVISTIISMTLFLEKIHRRILKKPEIPQV